MTYSKRTLPLASTLLLALGLTGGCDLPEKNLGDETAGDETQGSSDTEGPGGTGQTEPCMPGDQMPDDDGCNTCTCDDNGHWACTEIACEPPQPGGECEPGDEAPAGDGCNTCNCDENGYWACTLLGCPDTDGTDTDTGGGMEPGDPFSNNGVHICEGDVPFAPLSVDAAALEGNNLNVTLSHSGGCGEPDLYGMCWDGLFAESEPVQVWLSIAHEDWGDSCEAIETTDYTFSLASLAEAYVDGYGQGGTIIIHLAGWDESLEYTF